MARIPFIRKKNYNGITQKTVKNIQLGASAVFKNYNAATDTYASAKAAGKLLGATRGGVNLRIETTIEQLKVDGAAGRIKGLSHITTINVSAGFSLIEMTSEALAIALTAADIETSGEGVPTGYDVITGSYDLAEDDFIENITIIGCKSGADNPIIIQLYNGLNEDGLTLQTGDESSGELPVTIYAYNSIDELLEDEIVPPYKIFNPHVATTTTGGSSDPSKP